jgi:hypothetical protein
MMINPALLLACILLIACGDIKKEAISKAIRSKESNKGNYLDSYTILRSVDSLGVLKIYYEAKMSPGSTLTETTDSIIFYELGNGQLVPQP